MPKKRTAAITDAQRLDALEAFVRKEPLTLWSGHGEFPGGKTSGLGLMARSLREALDPFVIAYVPRRKRAQAERGGKL